MKGRSELTIVLFPSPAPPQLYPPRPLLASLSSPICSEHSSTSRQRRESLKPPRPPSASLTSVCPFPPSRPRQITSPPTQPGRASVAICIRLVPSKTSTLPSSEADDVPATSLEDFFSRDWVREDGVDVEILYIRRAKRRGDRWSSQLAFPGGRKNAEDESSEYTALR